MVTSSVARRIRRTGAVFATVLALSMIAVPVATAASPVTTPLEIDPPLVLDAGTVCADEMQFVNLALKGSQTVFPPDRRGTQVTVMSGVGRSRVTDVTNGHTYDFKGAFLITYVTAADGSVRVDAVGNDIVSWYLPGDQSVIGDGFFRTVGHLTEWYSADGEYLRNAFHGHAVDLCARLGSS